MAVAEKEKLQDGKILEQLMDRFIEDSTIENMHSIILCLVDSDLHVPMTPTISEEDQEQLNNAEIGDEVTLKQEMRIRPDLLQDSENNKLYFPVFSNVDKAPKEYSEHFSWINMNLDTIVNYIENNKEVSGIALNPMTDKTLIIEERIYELLKHVLSNVRKEENKNEKEKND